MRKYHVVQRHSRMELIESVEQLLAKGWHCQGGVSVMPVDRKQYVGLFTQAMTRSYCEACKGGCLGH